MISKTSLVGLSVILAAGLTACERNTPKALKARAEIAVSSGSPEEQKNTFDALEKAIVSEESKLSELGMDLGRWNRVKMAVKTWIKPSVRSDKRSEARKSLNTIIELSTKQIDLAKALKDDEKMILAEGHHTDAVLALEALDKEVSADQADEKSRSDAAQTQLVGP